MKQILLITSIILFFIEPIFSQSRILGKIPKDEWEIKKCNFDTTSKIVFLFDIGTISIMGKRANQAIDSDCKLDLRYFTFTFNRHLRIKIFENNDAKPIVFSFTLRSSNGKVDELSCFKGFLVRNENGKVIKNKINEKDLIIKNNPDRSCLISYELPTTNKESILDISYDISTKNFNETPEWCFSNDFPTLYSEINISLPEFFLTQKKCEKLNKLIYKSSYGSAENNLTYTTDDNCLIFTAYKYLVIFDKYILENIPASQLKHEDYKLKYYFTSINFNSLKGKKEFFHYKR